MASVAFTQSLAREYEDLFASCRITKQLATVDFAVERMLQNKARYEAVALSSYIPWWFVAIVHLLECSGRFDRHLHNGDPLTAKTTHVPAGRPFESHPPYTWEVSAQDALGMQGLTRVHNWTIARSLYEFERYNGFGYRRREINSPYLWSCSQHYIKGKYIADGTYSSTAVSKQIGAAILMRRLAECNELTDTIVADIGCVPSIVFSATDIVPYAQQLQAFLNTLPGIVLREDGWPGNKTSAAFFQVFGIYLKNDPRNH